LHALADGAGVRLFWATYDQGVWCLDTARWEEAAGWSAPQRLTAQPGGNREPFAVRDAAGRVCLFWSRREEVSSYADSWTLWRRSGAGGVSDWDREGQLTTVPANDRAADREPAAELLATGGLRVYFRSDRAGGAHLWALDCDPATGAVTAAAQRVLPGPSASR